MVDALALIATALLVNGQTETPRPPDEEKIRSAVARGLALVEKAASNYPKNRNCFSCHHQTLPMLAIVAARDHGQKASDAVLHEQADFTLASFEARVENLREGSGIGGRAITVAYGLWTLDLADHKPDETTEAMVTYLLKTQQPEGHWIPQSNRPPLEESYVMTTVLAAYGMQEYAVESQREAVNAAIAKATTWLNAAPLNSHEDKVARLWGLHLLDNRYGEVAVARQRVIDAQQDDGGWSQLPGMKSDAYATGQTLAILAETGLPTSDPAYQRGIDFLLSTQHEDGSWLVETRSKPIQVYFDNGDPHGKHQFISTPASSWAVAALAASLKAN